MYGGHFPRQPERLHVPELNRLSGPRPRDDGQLFGIGRPGKTSKSSRMLRWNPSIQPGFQVEDRYSPVAPGGYLSPVRRPREIVGPILYAEDLLRHGTERIPEFDCASEHRQLLVVRRPAERSKGS